MKRRSRFALFALGAILLTGLVATLAPLTDSTETARFDLESRDEGSARNLQVWSDFGTSSLGSCQASPVDMGTGGFVENDTDTLRYGFGTNIVPDTLRSVFVCVRNTGAQAAPITSVDVFGATDVDNACSGDEAVVDTTCGAGGAGELSSEIDLDIKRHLTPGATSSCATGSNTAYASRDGIADAALTGTGFTIPAGGYACVTVEMRVNAAALTTPLEIEENQSDTVTFRLRFNSN